MKIILLVGASGSGKTTIGKKLEEIGIPQLVSHTTRKQRAGETEGQDYYFVTEEEMKDTELIESSEYDGNIYGLSKEELESESDKHEAVYFITDKNGARQIQGLYPDETVYFWLKITKWRMIERMIKRGDKWNDISKRVVHAMDNGELKSPLHDMKNVSYTELDTENDIMTSVYGILNTVVYKEEV